MDLPLLVTLLVFAFGAVFLYFVGAVIVQALRLSILQVKSDVKIKMEKHEHELEQKKLYLDSKRLALTGNSKNQAEEAKAPRKRGITTIELTVEGETKGLKERLEGIEGVKKFAIFSNNLLLDLEGNVTPTKDSGKRT